MERQEMPWEDGGFNKASPASCRSIPCTNDNRVSFQDPGPRNAASHRTIANKKLEQLLCGNNGFRVTIWVGKI